MRSIKFVLLTFSLLACGDVAPTPDVCRRELVLAEVQALESKSAAELGLTSPVEFVDLFSYPVWCSCWSRRGVLQDADGRQFPFSARSRLCGEATSGIQWHCGTSCSGSYDWPEADPAKNRAIGVLLGVWLVREFSLDQIAGIPTDHFPCHSPMDATDRARFVLFYRRDPALMDLPIILLSATE